MFLGRSPPISRSQGSARSCPSSPEPRLYACPSPAGRGAALGVSRGPGGPTRSPALDLRPGQQKALEQGHPWGCPREDMVHGDGLGARPWTAQRDTLEASLTSQLL